MSFPGYRNKTSFRWRDEKTRLRKVWKSEPREVIFFFKIVEGPELGGPLHGASPCWKRLDGVSPDDEGVVRSFQVSPRMGLLESIIRRAFHLRNIAARRRRVLLYARCNSVKRSGSFAIFKKKRSLPSARVEPPARKGSAINDLLTLRLRITRWNYMKMHLSPPTPTFILFA